MIPIYEKNQYFSEFRSSNFEGITGKDRMISNAATVESKGVWCWFRNVMSYIKMKNSSHGSSTRNALEIRDLTSWSQTSQTHVKIFLTSLHPGLDVWQRPATCFSVNCPNNVRKITYELNIHVKTQTHTHLTESHSAILNAKTRTSVTDLVHPTNE